MRRRGVLALIVGLLVAGVGLTVLLTQRVDDPVAGPAQSPRPAPRATPATPATLAAVFGSAAPGTVIELAEGDYGIFKGAAKPDWVTLRAAPSARPRMSLELDGASHLRFEGLTLRSAGVVRSDHIELRDNRLTGPTLIDTRGGRRDHAIVLDGNTHRGIDVCDGCHEGRVTVIGDPGATQPAGVTIEHSFFGDGGNSDGIQVGAYGVRVLQNEFARLKQGDPDRAHTDAIQLYGQSHTVIRGNYLHDVATGIMAADGADHEMIEDNVIVTNGYPWAIVLGPDNGTTIRHNTLPGGRCSWEQECGTLRICSTCHPARPGRGTVIRDNVLGGLLLEDGSRVAAEDHNLVGATSFAGGAAPKDPAGYALGVEARGVGGASDGGDVGARVERVGPAAD